MIDSQHKIEMKFLIVIIVFFLFALTGCISWNDIDYEEKGLRYLEINENKKALNSFNKALEKNNNSANLWYYKCISEVELIRYEDAMNSVNSALIINPNFSIGLTMKGRILYETGRYNESIHNLQKSLSIDPSNQEAQFLLSLTLLKMGKNEESIRILDELIHKEPTDSHLINRKGQALLESGKLLDAKSSFDRVLILDKNNIEALLYKAYIYTQLGWYEEALGCCDKAIAISNHPTVWNVKSHVYFEFGDYLKSLEALDMSIELDPNNPVLYENKAATLVEMERYDEALEVYDKELLINPSIIYAYLGKGEIYLRKKEYDLAFEKFIHVLEKNPKNTFAEVHVSVALGHILEEMNESINDAETLLEFGMKEEAKNKYRSIFERSISTHTLLLKISKPEENPENHALIIFSLGISYYGLGKITDDIHNFDKAIQYLEKALLFFTWEDYPEECGKINLLLEDSKNELEYRST